MPPGNARRDWQDPMGYPAVGLLVEMSCLSWYCQSNELFCLKKPLLNGIQIAIVVIDKNRVYYQGRLLWKKYWLLVGQGTKVSRL